MRVVERVMEKERKRVSEMVGGREGKCTTSRLLGTHTLPQDREERGEDQRRL